MSPLQTNMTPKEGASLLLYGAERGINFLDTADLYNTYEHISGALQVVPDLVISTKSYAYDRPTAEKALTRALRSLKRDYVDIFMLHEQESIHTLRGHEEALLYWEKMREKGYIRALGISTHHVAAICASLEYPMIQVLHPIFNMRGLGLRDGSAKDMEGALEAAHQSGKGIFSMKPLGGGHLISCRREAFSYVLENNSVASVAVGMQSYEEIDYNCALASGLVPSESVAVKERHLLIQEDCAGCGKCVARCGENALFLSENMARVHADRCVFCGYCAAVCPLFNIKVV